MELSASLPAVWQPMPEFCLIEPGVVNIWLFPLRISGVSINSLSACLSPDEQKRAERYATDILIEEFVACRFLLRAVLSRYLHISPFKLDFHYNEHGKPFLSETDAGNISFNLSHSGGLGLLAITPDIRLGVDMEQHNPMILWQDIAQKEFTEREQALLKAAPEYERKDLFYRFWTRKESVLKGLGKGLSVALNCVDVSDAPAEPVRSACNCTSDPDDWWVHDIETMPGFAAACACSGAHRTFSFFHTSVDQMLPF